MIRRLAFAATLAGIAASPSLADYTYDELVVAVQALPGSLEPTQETSNVSLRITYNIYDRLIDFARSPDGAPEPALATAWRYVEPNILEVDIREGVLFHDGTDLSADDVAFTFGVERMLAEDAPAYGPTRGYFSNLISVEAVDDDTVQFILAEADPRFHLKLGLWTAEIISRDHYEAVGGLEAYAADPVGTGAYRVAEVVPGERIVLEAFDGHWRGAPAAQRVEFRLVPEVSTRLAGLLAGEFEIATDIPPDQLGPIEAADRYSVSGGPILNHRVVVFSQAGANAELMQDVHLRRALALAIDRDLIVETIWGGRTIAPAGHQWAEFGDLYIERDGVTYDPAAAAAELDLSRYDGQPLSYVTVDYYPNGIPVAEAMVAMWNAAGINVDFRVVESWSMRDEANPDFIDWSNSLPYPDPEAGMWRLWQPSIVERRGYGWRNEDFVEAGQTLATSNDLEARRAAAARMMDIWDLEDPAGIVPHQTAIFYGQSDAVNWQPYAFQFMDFGPRNLR